MPSTLLDELEVTFILLFYPYGGCSCGCWYILVRPSALAEADAWLVLKHQRELGAELPVQTCVLGGGFDHGGREMLEQVEEVGRGLITKFSSLVE